MSHPHPRKHHAHTHTDTGGSAHHGGDARGPVRASVITVSDTRTEHDDQSGALAMELLGAAGHQLVSRAIVRDERAAILEALRDAISAGAELVVLTGGTGIAARDVTYEAVTSVLEKTLDGFGEAFRRLSFEEIGARALLSRAVAGVLDGALVAALPGSAKAVKLGVEQLLLPIAPHAVGLLRG